MLVLCATEHGVHGVTKLVEEVLHHARGEEGGGGACGGREVQLQHHHRQLVTAIRPLPPTPNREVAVLNTPTTGQLKSTRIQKTFFLKSQRDPPGTSHTPSWGKGKEIVSFIMFSLSFSFFYHDSNCHWGIR